MNLWNQWFLPVGNTSRGHCCGIVEWVLSEESADLPRPLLRGFGDNHHPCRAGGGISPLTIEAYVLVMGGRHQLFEKFSLSSPISLSLSSACRRGIVLFECSGISLTHALSRAFAIYSYSASSYLDFLG